MCPIRIVRFTVILLLTVLQLPARPLSAQGEPQQPGQETGQVLPPPTAIPVPEIPQRVDAAQNALRGIQSRLARRETVTPVLDALPAFADTLRALLEDPAYRPGEGASLRTLEGIRRRWIPHQIRLAGWKATLNPRAQTLAADRDTLLHTRQVWVRTRAAAIEEEAPQGLVGRVTNLLGGIDTTFVRVNARLEQVLAALNQVNDGQRSVEEILSQVEAAEFSARQRLILPDSPPLWQAILSPSDVLVVAEEVRESLRQARREGSDYVRGFSNQLVLDFGIFLLFLLLFHAVRRQARTWSEHVEDLGGAIDLEGTTRILSRPFSAAFLLTVLAHRLVFPPFPTSVGVVIVVLLVIPVWRLLPPSVVRDFRGALFPVATLWVLGGLVTLTPDGSLLQRFTLLLIACMAGAGLVLALRPSSPVRHLASNQWRRATLLAGQVAVLIMGASVLANVLGFAALAEMLTRATIYSAVTALALSTVVAVLEGLTRTVLVSRGARRLQVIRQHSGGLTSQVLKLTHLGTFLLWIDFVLRQFGIHRPVLDALASTLGADLNLGTVEISLGDILAFAIVLWLSLKLARGIQMFLEEDLLRPLSLPRGVPAAISTLAHYAAVFIGFLMAAAAAGFDLSRFTLLAGAFGVGLGFGLQNVVNNFVSGLILIFERPVQVGDVLDVGGVQGQVKRIGIRASTVRTWSGAEVIVPNGDLISQQVTNWTLSDRLRRLEIPVGVRYGTDPERVIDALTEAAARHPQVLADPEVTTLFNGFGESSLDFVVRAWTSSDDWRIVQSDLAVAVNKTLKEESIEIPFPQRDLHLRSVSPEIKLKE
jgi:small-conductance mechanosensitive channel